MTFELDIPWLASVGLMPNDYVFLMCLHKRIKYPFVRNLPFVKSIEAMGYIKLTDQGVVLRQKFIDLIEGDFDQMFAELLATYPMKVGDNPQNLRILHAADIKAKSNKIAKDRYKKIVDGKAHVHRKIMKGLSNQLKYQRQNLQYMQRLEVWINAATWELWEDIEIKEDEGRRTSIL